MQLKSVCFLLTLVGISSSNVVFKNGGFDKVLIVIDESTKEADLSLEVDSLTNFFYEASKVLYVATKGHEYFRNIEILLPRSFAAKTHYEVAGEQSVQLADFIVAPSNPAHGDDPYVIQPGSCGDPGRFIHLTPKFFKSALGDKSAAKRLVQNFIKYRYGVYDESAPYPATADDITMSDFRPFYPKGSDRNITFAPTACGEVSGHMSHADGKDCRINNGWVDHECRFYPDSKQKVNSSLMYSAALDDIVEFCNDKNHNNEALNEQNEMCDYRSIWSVLLQHEDFRGFEAQYADLSKLQKPSIHFFQQVPLRRVVYVFDTSDSMEGCPMQAMLKAAKSSISALTLPVELGLVHFGTAAKILLKMSLVESPQDVREVLNNLPTSTTGTTCIKCGMKQALKALKADYKQTKGSLIILFSDGEETTPNVLDLLPDLTQAGIVVNTVSIGPEAEPKLTTLAQQTGGRSFTIGKPCDFNVVYIRTFLEVVLNYYENIVSSESLPYPTKPGQQIQTSVVIDQSVSRNTKIMIIYDEHNLGISMEINIPGGIKIEITELKNDFSGRLVYKEEKIPGAVVSKEHGLFVLQIEEIDQRMFGEWIITIKKSKSASVAASGFAVMTIITGSQKAQPTSTESLILRAQPSVIVVDLSRTDHVVIYAELFRGYVPVVNAIVRAYVYRENLVAEFYLYDHGKGVDSRANDGIYSGVFYQFENVKETRRYSVVIVAEGGSNTYVLGNSDVTINFKRTIQTFFQTFNGQANQVSVVHPPSTIRDFRVISYNVETREITISWSAPGGDFDHGTSSSYEIVYGERKDLVPKVSEKKVIKITQTLVPQESGSIETLTVIVEKSKIQRDNFCFRIRSFNKDKKYSEWSNLACTDVQKSPISKPVVNPPKGTADPGVQVTTSASTTQNLKITSTEPHAPDVTTQTDVITDEIFSTTEIPKIKVIRTTEATTTTTPITTTFSTTFTTQTVPEPPPVESPYTCPPQLTKVHPALLSPEIVKHAKVVLEVPLDVYLKAACEAGRCT